MGLPRTFRNQVYGSTIRYTLQHYLERFVLLVLESPEGRRE